SGASHISGEDGDDLSQARLKAYRQEASQDRQSHRHEKQKGSDGRIQPQSVPKRQPAEGLPKHEHEQDQNRELHEKPATSGENRRGEVSGDTAIPLSKRKGPRSFGESGRRQE